MERSVCLLFLALRNFRGLPPGMLRNMARQICHGEADRDLLQELAARISPPCWDQAEVELSAAEKRGVEVISLLHPHYPVRLRHIEDPPLVLFVRGNISSGFSIAVVGSRTCSNYGRRCAKELAFQIASCGGSVVSGLAFGIDSAAHQGALEACRAVDGAGPRNSGCAVLGSGVCCVYPAENTELAAEIIDLGGAVISEYQVLCNPRREYFPERNRIISGLSDAVIIVEAAERSGALITARLALEQGRDVFAVPGPIDSRTSLGTNDLLCQGALPVRSIEDIAEAVTYLKPIIWQKNRSKSSPTSAPKKRRRANLPFELSNTEVSVARSVLEILALEKRCHIDQLVDKTGVLPDVLNSVLCALELTESVYRLPGDYYSVDEYIDTN